MANQLIMYAFDSWRHGIQVAHSTMILCNGFFLVEFLITICDDSARISLGARLD